eukprot:456532-Rhodomonas_salina.1
MRCQQLSLLAPNVNAEFRIVPGGMQMFVKCRNNSTSIALPVLGSGMELCDVGYWESVCSHLCDAVRSRERVCSGTRIGH